MATQLPMAGAVDLAARDGELSVTNQAMAREGSRTMKLLQVLDP